MTSIQLFNFESKEVRTEIDEDNTVWFMVSDIAINLEYSSDNTGQIARDNCELDDLSTRRVIDSLGREQQALFVNKAGIYQWMSQSRKPKAKPLMRWITKEVIPAIERTGYYLAPQLDSSLQIANFVSREEYDTKLKEQIATAQYLEGKISRLEATAPYRPIVSSFVK